jgi:hypothetical protein
VQRGSVASRVHRGGRLFRHGQWWQVAPVSDAGSQQAGPAFAPGCSGRLLQLGACPSEAGAAGTTAAEVEQSLIGAAFVIGGALFGPLPTGSSASSVVHQPQRKAPQPQKTQGRAASCSAR